MTECTTLPNNYFCLSLGFSRNIYVIIAARRTKCLIIIDRNFEFLIMVVQCGPVLHYVICFPIIIIISNIQTPKSLHSKSKNAHYVGISMKYILNHRYSQ